jgi:outer membrane protein
MKKIILSALAVCAFTFASAQDKKSSNEGFTKGDVFVTGALSFSSDSKLANYSESNFKFSPSVGLFLTENIALGVDLTMGSGSVQATAASTTDKTSTFGLGLGARYYFTPSSQFSLFAGLGAGYVSMTTTPGVGTETKVNGFGVNFAPGINYFIAKNFSIEAKIAALSYTTAKGDWSGAENGSSLRIGGDWSAVSFGVNYKF